MTSRPPNGRWKTRPRWATYDRWTGDRFTGYLPPDLYDKALSLLYAYMRSFPKRKPRKALEPRPVAFSLEAVYLADVWFAQRMDLWRREGRIGHFGYLSPGQPDRLTPDRLHAAFPHLRRETARAVFDMIYPQPPDDAVVQPRPSSVPNADSGSLPRGVGANLAGPTYTPRRMGPVRFEDGRR